MGLITLQTIEMKEKLALARYRESQRAVEATDGPASATSSPASATSPPAPATRREPVSQPLPRSARPTEGQSSGSQPTSVTYTVRRGDTLRGIADWFYGDRNRASE